MRLRNQEGRTALDLATADDVRTLLAEADPVRSGQHVIKVSSSGKSVTELNNESRSAIAVGSDRFIQTSELIPSGTSLVNFGGGLVRAGESGDGCMDWFSEQERIKIDTDKMTVRELLARVDETYAELYAGLFEREQVSMAILAEMGHEQLREIGVSAFGARHTILECVDKFYKESK